MAADWSSLPSDLVHRIGDCLLATNDIDYYIDMHAVCHGWRSATAVGPRAQGAAGAAADPRFLRPHQWTMLDEEPSDSDDDGEGGDARLFLNLSTGRFLRRRVPLLRDKILVAASDGLLLLGDNSYPHSASVLNPFTGSLLQFSAPIPTDAGMVIASATNYEPMLVFVHDDAWRQCGIDVMCADPTSERFGEQFFRPSPFYVSSLVSHAGHAYMANDMEGGVVRSTGEVKLLHGELWTEIADVVVLLEGGPFSDNFLVSSAGELLLIRHSSAIEVFSVDAERKALRAVKSIGGRALFLGRRCLSVNADVLPSVDGDCVYYFLDCEYISNILLAKGMYYRHDLKHGIGEKIPGGKTVGERPFSLVQVLLTYCSVLPDVRASFRMYEVKSSVFTIFDGNFLNVQSF
jgi:hypothetical protein